MNKIFIGTHNQNKLIEIKDILKKINIEFFSLKDYPKISDVEENGSSYEENAIIKASHFSKQTGLPSISDDTGLEVDYLNGEPGIFSARWAGFKGANSYIENNKKLLKLLENVPMEKRTARFICVMVLVDNEKCLLTCKGVCEGKILFNPRGKNGFGYDPLFEVCGHNKTYAEMEQELKNKISHRGKALEKLKKELNSLI